MAVAREIEIDLGMERPDDIRAERMMRAKLTLTTKKGVRGLLESRAMVSWCCGGMQMTSIGMGCGGDFYRRIESTQPARITQKAIDMQHGRVFSAAAVAELVAAVKSYYGQAEAREPVAA